MGVGGGKASDSDNSEVMVSEPDERKGIHEFALPGLSGFKKMHHVVFI